MFCNMDGLLEPKPGAAGQEDSLLEGLLRLTCQVLLWTSLDCLGSPGHQLPQLLWQWPSGDKDMAGMDHAHACSC